MSTLGRLCASLTLCFVIASTWALEFHYHDNDDVLRVLRNLSETYPNITHLHSIGQSYQGRDLWVLVIGKYASTRKALIPNVKYIANMHGNEVVGREMLLHLCEHLLSNYVANETLTQFLDTTTVHVMPTMNPDGFNVSMMNDCIGLIGRGNANGVDLNRNFPDPHAIRIIPEQRETTLVRNWIHSVPFVLSANLHGGAMVVNYPYDSLDGNTIASVYAATPDDDVFRHLSLTFSRSHHNMHSGRVCSHRYFKDGITNGAEWYPVIGGMQDYMYRNASGYEVLIEMSCCKYPQPTKLERFWRNNKDALINYLAAVHMGVKGIVYHSDPLSSVWVPLQDATIVVVDREQVPFRSSDLGEYFKLLLPGFYTLKASHPRYQAVSLDFTVKDSVVTRLDVYFVVEPRGPPISQHEEPSTHGPEEQSTHEPSHGEEKPFHGIEEPSNQDEPSTHGPEEPSTHEPSHGIERPSPEIEEPSSQDEPSTHEPSHGIERPSPEIEEPSSQDEPSTHEPSHGIERPAPEIEEPSSQDEPSTPSTEESSTQMIERPSPHVGLHERPSSNETDQAIFPDRGRPIGKPELPVQDKQNQTSGNQEHSTYDKLEQSTPENQKPQTSENHEPPTSGNQKPQTSGHREPPTSDRERPPPLLNISNISDFTKEEEAPVSNQASNGSDNDISIDNTKPIVPIHGLRPLNNLKPSVQEVTSDPDDDVSNKEKEEQVVVQEDFPREVNPHNRANQTQAGGDTTSGRKPFKWFLDENEGSNPTASTELTRPNLLARQTTTEPTGNAGCGSFTTLSLTVSMILLLLVF